MMASRKLGGSCLQRKALETGPIKTCAAVAWKTKNPLTIENHRDRWAEA
jgi:hypothetical protein